MAVPINGYYAAGEVNLVESDEHELLCTEDDEAVISTRALISNSVRKFVWFEK